MRRYEVKINGQAWHTDASNKIIAIKKVLWTYHNNAGVSDSAHKHRRKDLINKESRYTIFVKRIS